MSPNFISPKNPCSLHTNILSATLPKLWDKILTITTWFLVSLEASSQLLCYEVSSLLLELLPSFLKTLFSFLKIAWLKQLLMNLDLTQAQFEENHGATRCRHKFPMTVIDGIWQGMNCRCYQTETCFVWKADFLERCHHSVDWQLTWKPNVKCQMSHFMPGKRMTVNDSGVVLMLISNVNVMLLTLRLGIT